MKLDKLLAITDKKQRICVITKKKQKYYEGPKDIPSKYGSREVVGQRFNKETEALEICIAKKGAENNIKAGDWSDEIKEIVNGLGVAKKGSSEELESYSTDQNKDDKKDEKDNDKEERIPKRFQKNNNDGGNRFNKTNDNDNDESESSNNRPAHHRNNNRHKNAKPDDTEE